MSVALFDTDQGLIYRANCLEVSISTEKALSPDVSSTPDYYNNRRFRAWFRFDEIEEWSESEVIGKSCLYPDANDTGVLLNVKDLETLRRMDSTMWLLIPGPK